MNCASCGATPAPDARFCSSCGAPFARAAAPQADPLRDLLQSALAPNIEIVRPLGRGGMGAVYLGREIALDREVAIKTLAPEVAGAPELRERFRREARIAAKLTHPNIVPLHTFGETRDVIYFVMGFVRGESLAEHLARSPMTPGEAGRILGELADALAYAHERGIVHRDIKPENVLIDDATGKAILTDFGIARMTDGTSLTRAGGFIGTPQYMSPEQARGEVTGPPSDVYSLGVLGYRMATGMLPVRSDSLPEFVAKLSSSEGPTIESPSSDVPLPLADAIMRCLRPDPAERVTAAQVRDAVRRDADAPDLPDELITFEGRAFSVFPFVLLAVLLIPFELLLWEYIGTSWRLLIQLFQFAAVLNVGLLAVGFSEGKRAGVPPRTIARIIVRQPRWYPGWVPSWARRPGDFYSRLPLPLKLIRIGATLCYVGFIPLLAMVAFAILLIQVNVDLKYLFFAFALLVVAAVLLVIFGVVYANIVMARAGLSAPERSRIISIPPLPKTLWDQPKYAALLSPETSSLPEGRPATPSLLAERIVIRARRLPSPAASEVMELERALAKGILGIDGEARRIDELLDPEDVERVERRLTALAGSDAAESSEVRRLLLDQARVFRDLAAKREALAARRDAWMLQLRALDDAVAGNPADLARKAAAIREFLSKQSPAAADESTAIQT